MNTYDPHAHNTAVHALVAAVWPLAGDAAKPDGVEHDEDGGAIDPYCVVYPLGSGEFDGSMAAADLQGDAWPVTQVTYVGRTRDHADQLRALGRAGVLGQAPVVTGRTVQPLQLDQELQVRRDDSVTPRLFYAIDRYRCYSTPA